MAHEPFRHWYGPTTFVAGRDAVEKTGMLLAEHGVERALVVTSGSVGADEEIMGPVRDGLGDALGGVFDGVTVEKTYATVQEALELATDLDADGVVSVGGGSTVDAARALSVVAVDDDDPASLFAEVTDDGDFVLSEIDGEPMPVFAVPTTLSGAEVTPAAGMNLRTESGEHVVRRAPIVSPKIWPKAVFYDPEVGAKTPKSVLSASAMNGFDHALEMVYSRNAVPPTDAVGLHGLRLLGEALPALFGDSGTHVDALERAMVGVALGTTGLIDPNTGPKYSLIHAFGHQVSQRYAAQQGAVHGVVAPHVLRFVFERVDGRRAALARALGVDAADDPETSVVEAVERVRDALGLPSRLRDIEGTKRGELSSVAKAIRGDVGVRFGPPELEPTTGELLGVLESAW